MSETLSAKLKALPNISEGPTRVVMAEQLERAVAVVEAVEAFQAAQREYDIACDLIDDDDVATRERATAAHRAADAALARLLEVNLG